MNPLDLFALAGMVMTPLGIGFGIAWWNTRKELEFERRLGRPAERSVERSVERSSLEVGQLAQAMDAIAVEVERIAEGQRFVTKLLAERAAADRAATERAALPAPEPRVITPH